MKLSKIPIFVAVFVASLAFGRVMNGKMKYPCIFEPHVLTKTAEPVRVIKKGGAVNINAASAEELATLRGIGAAIAGRIVKFRNENGPFEVKEDILKVPGIGEKKFEGIRDYIEVTVISE